MAPTLTALLFVGAGNAVAYAQGTIDFSGANTLMNSFQTFAIYAGAVICFGGLIFAGIRMLSGRFTEAIPGLFGALFGAAVLGWGAGWIGELEGRAHTTGIFACPKCGSERPLNLEIREMKESEPS